MRAPVDKSAELGNGTTARVVSFVRRGESSTLVVEPPTGVLVELQIPEPPDHGRADDLTTEGGAALAVRLCPMPTGYQCWVFMTSRSGPKRVDVPLAVALALCERGVHAVVMTSVKGSSATP